jgi:hypothetical protein
MPCVPRSQGEVRNALGQSGKVASSRVRHLIA